MEKPFLLTSSKLDEVSLRIIFVYNLNQLYPILLHLANYLPTLAQNTCYGDLQYVIEEFLAEVKIQIVRVENIFIRLKEVPSEEKNCLSFEISSVENTEKFQDKLLKDLSVVFCLQQLVAVEYNYFHILKSIANSLNDITINEYLQYSFDECKDNHDLFQLVAKEYMESNIGVFLK